MPRKTDIRSQRTKDDIKQALLVVLKNKPLANISIAEVAREAGISRTTFYTHYDCLASLYDELVLDFQYDVQTLKEHLNCVDCRNSRELVPLCDKMRNPGIYEPVLADPRFVETWFRMAKQTTLEEYEHNLMKNGLSKSQAQGIMTFQLSGCIAAARSNLGKSDDWASVQHALDAFIAAGLKAVDELAKEPARKAAVRGKSE